MATNLVLGDARDLRDEGVDAEGTGCGSCCGLWLVAHGFSNEALCSPCDGGYQREFWQENLADTKFQNGGITISVQPPEDGFNVPDNENFTILDLDGEKLYIRTLKQHIYHGKDD